MGHRFINRSQWFLAQQIEPDYQYTIWNSSRILNSSRAYDTKTEDKGDWSPLWAQMGNIKTWKVTSRCSSWIRRDVLYVSLSEGNKSVSDRLLSGPNIQHKLQMDMPDSREDWRKWSKWEGCRWRHTRRPGLASDQGRCQPPRRLQTSTDGTLRVYTHGQYEMDSICCLTYDIGTLTI